MRDAKSQRERDLFLNFAGQLDLPAAELSNPNEAGPETGMDVVAKVGDRRIGVQLTDYHSDEDQTQGSKGRTLRSEEQRKAKEALRRKAAKVYGGSAPGETPRVADLA
jgi:hypothetical protein